MSESRLNTAMHTGFAGALALAAGSSAYGAIIVVAPPANVLNNASPASNPPAPATGIPWDVNGDAVADFALQFRNPQAAAPGDGVQWQANFSRISTAPLVNAVVGYLGTFINYGTKLNGGDPIGPATPAANWKNQTQVCLGSFYRYAGTITGYGQFVDDLATATTSVVRGFVGFRFDIGGQTRYGWVDVEVRGAGAAAGSGGMFFFGAAYEDSGQPIQAGAVPTPGSLAALALGAAMCGRRKRRCA